MLTVEGSGDLDEAANAAEGVLPGLAPPPWMMGGGRGRGRGGRRGGRGYSVSPRFVQASDHSVGLVTTLHTALGVNVRGRGLRSASHKHCVCSSTSEYSVSFVETTTLYSTGGVHQTSSSVLSSILFSRDLCSVCFGQ